MRHPIERNISFFSCEVKRRDFMPAKATPKASIEKRNEKEPPMDLFKLQQERYESDEKSR